MCAALSSYVFACAAKGVLLSGWRDKVCCEYAVGHHRFYIPTLATGILQLWHRGHLGPLAAVAISLLSHAYCVPSCCVNNGVPSVRQGRARAGPVPQSLTSLSLFFL